MSNSSSAFFFYDRKLTWMEQQLWWGEGRAETGSSGQPLSNFPQSRRLCSWTKVPLWAKPHHDTEQMYLHPAEESRRKNLIPKSDMNINHLLTLVRDWWVWLRKSLSHSTTLAWKKNNMSRLECWWILRGVAADFNTHSSKRKLVCIYTGADKRTLRCLYSRRLDIRLVGITAMQEVAARRTHTHKHTHRLCSTICIPL